MRKYCIPQPTRVRRIEHSFAWIDHRLLRNGYLELMTHHEQALYLFLALVADRHGVSYYRKEKICDHTGLDWGEFEVARGQLIDFQLIAFQPYNTSNPNGYYQVLPVDGQPLGLGHTSQASAAPRRELAKPQNDVRLAHLEGKGKGSGLPCERPRSDSGAWLHRLNGPTGRADHAKL